MFYIRMQNNNVCDGLLQLIKDYVTKETEMVEVGCFSGVSSELFAKHCKKIHCVDIWDSGPQYDKGMKESYLIEAKRLFKIMKEDYTNISMRVGFSNDVAKTFADESIDLIYIDARHDYEACKEDLLTWIPKVKKGGWICGHDIKIKGVFQAVNEVLGTHYKEYIDESYAIQK